MKTCAVCHQPKPLSGFYKQPRTSDGYAGVCRSCTKRRTADGGPKTEKECARCGETKPINEFYKNKRRGDGRSPYCVPCTKKYANGYYATVSHDCIVAKAYGLERGQYAKMLAAQEGLCGICGQPETAQLNGAVKRLPVDHDHQTGAARELLCQRCNSIIGYAQDDKKILLAAIDYLERHGV